MSQNAPDLTKTLTVDLERGVVPISRAASSLAALIKRCRAQQQPIIVTQKGYPTGVILSVEQFSLLHAFAEGRDLSLSAMGDEDDREHGEDGDDGEDVDA